MVQLFCVNSGIQYWASHYLENTLGVSKAKTVSNFLFVVITSPVSGAIISGLVAKKIGGYESKRIVQLALVPGFIVCCCVLPVPYVENYKIAVFIIWIVLFCGAFILPILNGVMLCVVEPELKEHAQSIANICFNLFGKLPAPTMYGAMNRLDPNGENKSKYGMTLILYISITAVAGLVVLQLIRTTKAV